MQTAFTPPQRNLDRTSGSRHGDTRRTGASKRNGPLLRALSMLIAASLVLAAGVAVSCVLAGPRATGVTHVCAETPSCAPETTPHPAAPNMSTDRDHRARARSRSPISRPERRSKTVTDETASNTSQKGLPHATAHR